MIFFEIFLLSSMILRANTQFYGIKRDFFIVDRIISNGHIYNTWYFIDDIEMSLLHLSF